MSLVKLCQQIGELLAKIDHDGDAITFCKQTQAIAKIMSCFETDSDVLVLFQHINQLALDSEDIAIGLPHVLVSRAIQDLRFKNSQTNVRNEVLRILQVNYTNHKQFKSENPEKAYNAITLLGEFYNLLRIHDQPISVVGQSLLQLLRDELHDFRATLCTSFAKLLLTQVTLNGTLFKKYEPDHFDNMLDAIRRAILEANEISSPRSRAFLMLVLELNHTNFTAKGMNSLNRVYGGYLHESQATTADGHSCKFSQTAQKPYILERQQTEVAVQTEVAICDVFRAGPSILSPIERASVSTTCTSPMISREENFVETPLSPVGTTTSSGTPKSKIDPKIRNVKIGRIYPNPVFNTSFSPNLSTASVSSTGADSSDMGKLSLKNVTLHELAMMKDNSLQINRITNDYLNRLVLPYKSSHDYTGKENVKSIRNGNDAPRTGSDLTNSTACNGSSNNSRLGQKYQIDENLLEAVSFDQSYFDDYVPHHEMASRSFLQFLENK